MVRQARPSTQAPRAPRQAQPGQALLIRGIAQSSSSTQDVAGDDDIIESSSKRARTDDDEDDGTNSGGAEVEYDDYPMFDENDVVQTIEKDDHNESFELVSPSYNQLQVLIIEGYCRSSGPSRCNCSAAQCTRPRHTRRREYNSIQ
jgi:hypothetical protein